MKHEPLSSPVETPAWQLQHPSTHAQRDPVGAFVPGKFTEWQATSKGPLDGLSCGVKDVFDISGCTTGYGNPVWEQTHPMPATDAYAVAKLRQNGARVVGKTVTDELAFSLAGNNYHYGSPTNPAAPDRLTGGSSCGSAAAVAAGLCDIGLGTDTAGSVRAPASFCGVFGIRTTHGAVATEGVRHLAQSFDTIGWLTRDAQTLAAVGDVLLPESPCSPDPYRWVSFDAAWNCLPASTQQAASSSLRDLQAHLGERESLPIEIHELDHYMAAFRTIQFFEVWKELGGWVERTRPVLGPDIQERMLLASKVSRGEYDEASKVRKQLKDLFASYLENGRVIIMPTVSGPAPMRASCVAELNIRRHADLRFLCIASMAGLPQISIPLLADNGAPLGVSVIGAAGADKSLLAFAERLEATRALDRRH